MRCAMRVEDAPHVLLARVMLTAEELDALPPADVALLREIAACNHRSVGLVAEPPKVALLRFIAEQTARGATLADLGMGSAWDFLTGTGDP